MLEHFITENFFKHFRLPRDIEDDNDCDMLDVRHDDTDIESFEREEERMEQEAAQVKILLSIMQS